MNKKKSIILAIATAIPLILIPYVIWLGLKVANSSIMKPSYTYVQESKNNNIPDHMMKKILEQSGEKNVIMLSEVRAGANKLVLLRTILFLYVFALSIIYIVIIAQNDNISSGGKAFWIIAILFVGPIAMALYWFKYVLKALPKEAT